VARRARPVVYRFQEVLDTTIRDVALRYLGRRLCCGRLPISEWRIPSYLGRQCYILSRFPGLARLNISVAVNYACLAIHRDLDPSASALCGVATSLGQLILFRVSKVLAGGGLQTFSQGSSARYLPPPGKRAPRKRPLQRRQVLCRNPSIGPNHRTLGSPTNILGIGSSCINLPVARLACSSVAHGAGAQSICATKERIGKEAAR